MTCSRFLLGLNRQHIVFLIPKRAYVFLSIEKLPDLLKFSVISLMTGRSTRLKGEALIGGKRR